ncbi:MAG: FIST C-terminal domain-containing protein [Candidatus Altiarchaeales archaeon]|nr:FIST C-terminal domain-containing protein [Candidatus Altiarchaeota archaeon]MBU4266072.1 FIST C-terminal domain-containing protein [Candidatus Altiarchaeota archaeon]MBU4341349.1 FIST C-terminal domain-containing protein [Candidatus Altiarchaeota archaeon]MBU4437114.1 FIST C-terminal domain-containing protein [Candidatus Altiarchaeota archaeon]MCG2783006.1 FIST C-terminal domain-containing protein [Candidatus Altiarchaeales archaeon]
MIQVGVGRSDLEDSLAAGKEAAGIACSEVGCGTTFSLMFCSVKFEIEKVLEGVRSVITGPMMGCSTAGEITNKGVSTGSVVVMCIKSDKITVGLGVGENIGQDARKAGQNSAASAIKELGEEMRTASQIFVKTKSGKFANLTPFSMITLPDALTGGGADVVRGITDVVGLHFPVVGGSPGDDLQMKKTYEFCNDKIYSDAVVSAVLRSDLVTGFGVRHGWHPVGKPMIVTKSKGGQVYEIDGQPAIKAYEEFFGKEITEEALGKEFSMNSLGIPAWESEYRLRWPILKKEDSSIICAGEIPQDSVVRIMEGDEASAIAAAKAAAREAMISADEPDEIAACIVFDCISRKQLLGDRAGKEIEAIQSVVGKETPLIGFYTYGEQAPTSGAPAGFHNQTVVVYIISKTTEGEMVARSI